MESRLVSWVAQKGKAGSAAQISQLLMFNVLACRSSTVRDAVRRGRSPGAEYFKIDPHGDKQKVRDEFSFALSLGRWRTDVRLFIVAG
jgi:hypothetical protein